MSSNSNYSTSIRDDHDLRDNPSATSKMNYVAIAAVIIFVVLFFIVVKPLRRLHPHGSSGCLHQSLATDYNDLYIVTVASAKEYHDLKRLV